MDLCEVIILHFDVALGLVLGAYLRLEEFESDYKREGVGDSKRIKRQRKNSRVVLALNAVCLALISPSISNSLTSPRGFEAGLYVDVMSEAGVVPNYRGRQKRDFRRLWITRINAATRVYNVFNSYSKLIHSLSKKELILNRKMLAQVAVSNPNNLYMISNKIRTIN
ncbi:hypothetical protein SORBI_3010G208750 [Sorghum bicolor]|uniref:Large ribosomal subunit protein bL20c n=1 Tax=Sorghum bicolor TaxID=4558 RepID=A0A1W0VU42_SORBI|nr:hypothetical protein SORBI_3010G208750 [Sorghum bicolor]